MNGPIYNYIVQCSAHPNGSVKMKEQVIDFHTWLNEWVIRRVSTSVTGLTPYTNYSIKVAAVNIKGFAGPYSNPIIAQTEEDSKL